MNTITNEQIKQAFERPELLRELFPDAFKPVLEAGKWYLRITIGKDTSLFNFSGSYDEDNNPLGYGINIHGDWKDLDNNGWEYDEIRPATSEEVETALIAEAKKRGFKEGVKFKTFHGVIQTMSNNHSDTFFNIIYMDDDFNIHVTTPKKEWHNANCNSNPFIFSNGVWAEIIKETEIELTLDEIAEKFGVDKVKIKK